MKSKKIYSYTIFLSFLTSYIVVHRLFQQLTFRFFPEILLIAFSFFLGMELKLVELLITSALSVAFSFVLLQVLSFIFFGHFGTFDILLTAIAKGSVLFGISSMLITIAVGSVSNLVFYKKKGS